MHTAAATALLVLPIVGLSTVAAMDMSEPGLETLLRAVSFSPWGAVMVYVFWTGKKAIIDALDKIAALWTESLVVGRAWVTSMENLVAMLQSREAMGGDPYRRPAKSQRPKTNPVNLPIDRDRER